MLDQKFLTNGFSFISSEKYLNTDNASSLHDLKKIFDTELQEDGSEFRKRAYLKLNWIRDRDAIKIAKNQMYFQTPSSNITDGGKMRQFKVMTKKVLDIPIVKNIILINLQMIKSCPIVAADPLLTIGLHFIRYQVKENGASYSSPDWLHKDDEPLVLIHLINLSRSALGGDNLIADSENRKVTHVVRLENEIDTLALNKNVYHAVTPLGSKHGIACRDVILFTVEPDYTQKGELA